MEVKDLIGLYESDYSSFEKHIKNLSFDDLDAVALFIAKQYLINKLDWNTASSLCCDIWYIYDFQRTSEFFWDIYLAFEDAETSDTPDEITVPALKKILKIEK